MHRAQAIEVASIRGIAETTAIEIVLAISAMMSLLAMRFSGGDSEQASIVRTRTRAQTDVRFLG
jgi:hypothetical protein